MSAHLLAAGGVFLLAASLATAIFVARAVRTVGRSPARPRLEWDRSFWAKLHMLAVIIGWGALVFFGVKGGLSWLPRELDALVTTVAGLATLGSYPVLQQLEQLPLLRHQLRVSGALEEWQEKVLPYPGSVSDGTLKELEGIAEDEQRSLLERDIAAAKLEVARALAGRDERTQKMTADRIEREQAERQEAQRLRERREAAATAAAARRQRVENIIAQLPAVDAIEQVEGPDDVAVALPVVQAAWKLFKSAVVVHRPQDAAHQRDAAQRLEDSLLRVDDLQLPDGAGVRITYEGTERDGFCDAFALIDGRKLAFADVVHVRESLPGLLLGFFMRAGLRRAWSWGHGLYDRDDELLLTSDQLLQALHDVEVPNAPAHSWPPAGVRVRKEATGHTVACLALRPGRGLVDLTVQVFEGRASPLTVREVHKWGGGIFY